MLSQFKLISSFNFFAIFLLGFSLALSTTPHPLTINEVKLDVLFLVFQFISFRIKFVIYLTLVSIFSIFQEMIAGAPLGFYIIIYTLSLIGPVYLIRKHIYQINFSVFITFIMTTGLLKLTLSTLLLTNIYDSDYLYAFFPKIGLIEFAMNFLSVIIIIIIIYLVKNTFNLLHILAIKINKL